MKYIETGIADLWLCEAEMYEDDRGYFFEAFNRKDFAENTGLTVDFVQQNQSRSAYGTLRGMHLQKGVSGQAKLLRVIQGEVLDVVVDLRKDSATFGQHYTVLLSRENNRQLFVPRHFAHGFLVLQPETTLIYSCDNYYDKAAEVTLHYKDAKTAIDWPAVRGDYILSKKDAQGLDFKTVVERLYGK